MKFEKDVVEYIKANIDMERVKYISGCIWRHHSSLWAEDYDLYYEICNYIEEYNEDNDTEYDYTDYVEELFYELFD